MSDHCSSKFFTTTSSGSLQEFSAFSLEVENLKRDLVSGYDAGESDSDSSDAGDTAFTAEDFFDINELADEAPIELKDPKDDYDDIEEAIPAAKVSADGSHSDRNGDTTDDKQLMPPPPQNAAPSMKQDETDSAESDAKSKVLQHC